MIFESLFQVCATCFFTSILPGQIECPRIKAHLYGDGDADASILATMSGFLIPKIQLVEKAIRGAELGRTVNLPGETIEEFFAPSDGIVVMLRAWPVIQPMTASSY